MESMTTKNGNTIVTVYSSLVNKSKSEIKHIINKEWENKNPVLIELASVLAKKN